VPSVHAGSARCLSNAVVEVADALSGECASAFTVPTHKNGKMSTPMSRRMLRTATIRSPRPMLEITPSGNGVLSVLYPTILVTHKVRTHLKPSAKEGKTAQCACQRRFVAAFLTFIAGTIPSSMASGGRNCCLQCGVIVDRPALRTTELVDTGSGVVTGNSRPRPVIDGTGSTAVKRTLAHWRRLTGRDAVVRRESSHC